MTKEAIAHKNQSKVMNLINVFKTLNTTQIIESAGRGTFSEEGNIN